MFSSGRLNALAKTLETSWVTFPTFQDELIETFPINPISDKRALLAPLGIGISSDIPSRGKRHTTSFVYTFDALGIYYFPFH